MIKKLNSTQEGNSFNGRSTPTNSLSKPPKLASLIYATNKNPNQNGRNSAITQLQSAQQNNQTVPSSLYRPHQHMMTPRELLDNRLQIQLGRQLHMIPGDGHCLFRCIAKFVTQEDDHLDIRRKCADYIRLNYLEYKTLYQLDHEYSEDRSFESYLLALGQPNGLRRQDQSWAPLWGGELELLAMSKQHQIEISVYQHDDSNGKITRTMIFNENNTLPNLSVLYAGGTHYDFLQPVQPLVPIQIGGSPIPPPSIPLATWPLDDPPPLSVCDSSDDEDDHPDHNQAIGNGNQLTTSKLPKPNEQSPPPGISVIKTNIKSAAIQNALRNSAAVSAKHKNRQHQLLETRLSIQLNGILCPISGDGHSAFRCIAKYVSDEGHHLTIRQQCADYILDNAATFLPSYTDDIYGEHLDLPFETYVMMLRNELGHKHRNGNCTPVRGQSMALEAASQRYQIGIDVYHFKPSDKGALRMAASFNGKCTTRLSLLLSGADHYDYVKIKTDSTDTPPSKSSSTDTLPSRRSRSKKERKAQRPYRQTKIDHFLNGQVHVKTCTPPARQYDEADLETLRIMVHNTNGQSSSPHGSVLWAQSIDRIRPDIIALIDTRVSESAEPRAKASWTQLLPEYVTHHATTKPSGGGKVGGITFILSPKLKTATNNRYHDEYKMGVAMAVDLTFPGEHIFVISAYWTTIADSEKSELQNSLWQRIKRQLLANGSKLSPLEYIKRQVEEWTTLAKSRGWTVLLLGDLNSGWKTDQGQHGDCAPWAERFEFNNQPYEYAKSRGESIITHPRGKSHIDHILTCNYKLVCTNIVDTTDELIHDKSDHVPLVVDFSCRNIRNPPSYTPTPERHIDISAGDNKLAEKYGDWMKDSNCPRHPPPTATPQELANYLDDLVAYAVSGAALATLPFRKKKFFHGWSPQLMSNIYHMQFLMGLKRQIDRWRGTSGWTPCDWISGALLRLHDRIRSTQKDTSLLPDTSTLTIDGFSINDWKQNHNTSKLLEIFEHHRAVVKRRLHVDCRIQDRIIISEYTKQNMKLYQDKKYKRLISAIFGKYRKSITEITLAGGNITLDPIVIHDTIETYICSIHHLNTATSRGTDWIAGVQGHDFLAGNELVPKYLRDKIAKSFSKHKNNLELHSTMAAALRANVTFEEFNAEIKSRPNGKSGGISGFTINMLKALPIEIQASIFDVMNDLWKLRSDDSVIPESWFHRWICTVPKVKGACDIKQIRPISLYEVLRKIWTSIINKRISAVWEQLGTLHSSQHAYRLGMGTDTELIQIINIIEDASQHNNEIILSEFDTAKAFDSVNKDLMVAAWMRLGVPKDVAVYLVKMDNGGLSIPKTPHAISVLGTKRGTHKTSVVFTDRSRSSNRSSVRGFTARDGIGQGDSPSANAWTAVFDILLCALDDIDEPPYLYRKRDDELAAVKPLAYADDLNTISPSIHHAQATADIVSAYNYITGFQTNVGKIKFTTNSVRTDDTITVYDSKWMPCKKKIDTKHGGQILGIPIDLTNKWTVLKKSIANKISEICQPILSKKIGMQPKLLAYTMVAIPAVVYKAKFLNFSLDQYTKLFAPIDALLRRVCHLQRSFPKHLLHLAEKFGGLQLPDLVEQVQIHKMSTMYRALRIHSPALDSGISLLERCLVNGETSSSIIGNHHFDNFDHQSSWYRSVLQWQAMSGIHLERTAASHDELTSLQTIIQYCRPANKDQCLAIIKAYDINFLQDITAQSGGIFRERLIDHPVNACLTASIPAILNSEPNILQIGKIYLNAEGQAEEFSGLLNGELQFRQWTSQQKSSTVKVGHFIQPIGYKIRSEQSCIELLAQVHCLAEENLDGTTHGIKVIAIQPEKPPVYRRTIPKTTTKQNNSNLIIFTDGGRKEILSRRQLIFGEQFSTPSENVLTATGAIVLIRHDTVEQLYAIDGFVDKISDVHSFEAEEVPIITALLLLGERIRGSTLFTDSESVYKKLQSARWKRSNEMHEDPFISTIYKLSTQLEVTISFIHGHAEKQKKRRDWTFTDKGNVAADWVTRGRFEDVFELYQQNVEMTKVHTVNFNSPDLVSKLFATGTYTFAKGGFPIASYQMRKLHAADRFNTYLQHRTNISTRHIDWTSLSLSFSASVIKKSVRVSKFTLGKLIYGKYDDSQYKDVKQTCPMCGTGTDDRDHLLHCRMTHHLWDIAQVENIFTPADRHLCERMHISPDQLFDIRQSISDIITTDAFTRLGIFNKPQQDRILLSVETAFVDESIGNAIRREIEQQLAPWIRAMTAAIKLRNASKYATKLSADESAPRERIIDYNIFDELSDQSSENEIPDSVRVTVSNRHRETTDLLYSQEALDEYITDDLFLTCEDTNPTSFFTQFPQSDTTCLPWTRFRSSTHSMWITPLLQPTHMSNNAGLRCPAIASAQLHRQHGFRHISANNRESTLYATRLILALEGSMYQKQLSTLVDRYLSTKYGGHLSPDLLQIKRELSSIPETDQLLHFLNWNPRALSIIHDIFEPAEYEIPEDLPEYSWEEVVTPIDTSKRSYILVTEGNTTTIAYFIERPNTRQRSQTVIRHSSAKRVEHNLASVKKFHHSGTTKLSTFHLDSARPSQTSDPNYLSTTLDEINRIRQFYDRNKPAIGKPDISSLHRTLDDINKFRTHLDRTLLSRHRYNRIRSYTGTIRMRILRQIDRLKHQKNEHQAKITQYFPIQIPRASENSDPDLSSDQFEDYRGESD